MSRNGTTHVPFAFRIRYISANLPPDVPHQAVMTVGNHFRPPTNHEHFLRETTEYLLDGKQHVQDQIFGWRPSIVWAIHPDDYAKLTSYRSTTLFWCNDRMGYLVLPFDCTQTDVEPYPDSGIKLYDSDDEGTPTPNVSDVHGLQAEGIPISWRRLTFGRELSDDPFSKIGYYQEYYRLGARVPEEWNNFLVPPTHYRKHSGSGRYQDQNGEPHSQIAGDLGAILALCAFCSSMDRTPETIRKSFRPQSQSPAFRRPENAIPYHERAYDRGVVVDIYHDPQPGRPQQLRAWENGDHGPILT